MLHPCGCRWHNSGVACLSSPRGSIPHHTSLCISSDADIRQVVISAVLTILPLRYSHMPVFFIIFYGDNTSFRRIGDGNRKKIFYSRLFSPLLSCWLVPWHSSQESDSGLKNKHWITPDYSLNERCLIVVK